MGDFVKAATTSDIASGSMKTVVLGGKSIAIANVDGEFFAIADTCSHEQCSLGGEGFLDANVVTCGCHGGQFDVTNGNVMALPASTNVQSYPVKVEGSDILVQV